MTAVLSRLGDLGIAREATPGTWLAPVRFVPVLSPQFEDVVDPLRDESFRSNDAILQGIYPGPSRSSASYSCPHGYVDVLGDHLRAMGLADTYTAGVSTTLSSASAVNATSISTAASIPAGSTIAVDTGTNLEWAVTGTPTGAGPYTIPITTPASGLTKAHNSGVTVVAQATHAFAQSVANRLPTYSLTDYNGVETRGYPYSVLEQLTLKIDPKAAVSFDAKWQGFPSATQTLQTPSYGTQQPFLGWQWGLTMGGVASTRGISLDYTFKRALEHIDSSDGTQGPRELTTGGLEVDLKAKAIFDVNTDFLTFLAYANIPVVTTITQPTSQGGAVLTVTSSAAKVTKVTQDRAGVYAMVEFDASAQFNSTDAGIITASLKNYVSSQY